MQTLYSLLKHGIMGKLGLFLSVKLCESSAHLCVPGYA